MASEAPPHYDPDTDEGLAAEVEAYRQARIIEKKGGGKITTIFLW